MCRQQEAEDQVLKNKFKSEMAQTFNSHLGDTCVGMEKYLMLMNNKFIQIRGPDKYKESGVERTV